MKVLEQFRVGGEIELTASHSGLVLRAIHDAEAVLRNKAMGDMCIVPPVGVDGWSCLADASDR